MNNKENGITLIALVVTIVLLLLLSAISINAAIGDDGLVNRSFNAKIDKEKQEAATAVVEAISRVQYYSNVSGDKGVTISTLLNTLNLEKYTNGKIYGIKSDGKNTVVYFSNETGSYTVTVDENGGTKVELGIVVKKGEENNAEMAVNEKITLSSDEEIIYWVIVSGDENTVELNEITGEVIKKGEGEVVIRGYKSVEDANAGKYVEITIKDKKEEASSVVAESGENTEENNTGNTEGSSNNLVGFETVTISGQAYTGSSNIGKMQIGEHSWMSISHVLAIITAYIYNEEGFEGKVEVFDKYKNGIVFDNIEYYEGQNPISIDKVERISLTDSVTEVPDNIFNNFIKVNRLELSPSLIKLGSIVDGFDENDIPTKGLINLEYLSYDCKANELVVNKRNKNWSVYASTNSSEFANTSGVICGRDYYDFKYTKLKTIYFGDKVKRIPAKIFSHCESLEEITIKDNLESIGESAFLNCKKLKKITYPFSLETWNSLSANNVKLIEEKAFALTGLNSIFNSNQVSCINSCTYWGCQNIKNLNIPTYITKIDISAFCYCTGLKSLVFNNGIIEIGSSAFLGCNNLDSVLFNSVLSLKKIGGFCFRSCYELDSIELPDSIEEVGKFAFLDDKTIASIKFPKNINVINEEMCNQCYKLQTIIWPEVDFEIKEKAFMNCKLLTSVNIPNVTKIGVCAFNCCFKIENVSIGYKCKEINEKAFMACYALKSIDFNTQLNGQYKIYPRRYDLDTEQFVTTGEKYALSDGIEYIGINAFDQCDKLTEVTLPDSIKHIDRGCFSRCYSLKKIIFNCNNCTYDNGWIDGVFYPINYISSNSEYYSGYEEIEIGPAVDYIPDGIISYNSRIRNVTIPWTVLRIGNNAFKKTLLLNEVVFDISSHDDLYNSLRNNFHGLDDGKDGCTFTFIDIQESCFIN